MGREGAAFRQRRSSNHHLWKCHPPLCHPDPDSCHVALDFAACAPFREERRMKCINATNFNRNPGERSRGICGAPRLPHKSLGFVSSHTDSLARTTIVETNRPLGPEVRFSRPCICEIQEMHTSGPEGQRTCSVDVRAKARTYPTAELSDTLLSPWWRGFEFHGAPGA
jgi:hypothetical protein